MSDFRYAIQAICEIKEKHGKTDADGVMECPKCKGKLYYSVLGSYNGHTRGKCESKNCLNWIE